MRQITDHLNNFYYLSCDNSSCSQVPVVKLDEQAIDELVARGVWWDFAFVGYCVFILYHVTHNRYPQLTARTLVQIYATIQSNQYDLPASECDRMIVAVNEDSQHFKVFVFHYPSRTFDILDGFTRQIFVSDRLGLAGLSDPNKRVCFKYIPPGEAKHWRYTKKSYYHQYDNSSCGPIAVMNFYYALTGTTLFFDNPLINDNVPCVFNAAWKAPIVALYNAYVDTLVNAKELAFSRNPAYRRRGHVRAMMRLAEAARRRCLGVERSRSKGKGPVGAEDKVGVCRISPIKAKSEGQAEAFSPGAKRIKKFREKHGDVAKAANAKHQRESRARKGVDVAKAANAKHQRESRARKGVDVVKTENVKNARLQRARKGVHVVRTENKNSARLQRARKGVHVVRTENKNSKRLQRARKGVHVVRTENKNSKRSQRQSDAATHTAKRTADILSDEFLNSFESNVFAAQMAFHFKTGNWKFNELRNIDFSKPTKTEKKAIKKAIIEEMVSDGDVVRCMENFTKLCDPCIPCIGCACCGWLEVPITDPRIDGTSFDIRTFTKNIQIDDVLLEPLHYTVEENTRFDADVPSHIDDTDSNREKWLKYREVFSQIVRDDVRYHLYPELVKHDGSVNVCNECSKQLQKGERPEISIANGMDLGGVNRVGLSKPSFALECCISRSRVLCSALNIRLGQAGTYAAVSGHTICFMDQAADTCAQQMPDPIFAEQGVVVCLKGPTGMVHSPKLEGILKKYGSLKVQPKNVIEWLTMLKFVNPYYYTITVKDLAETTEDVDNFLRNLIKNCQVLESNADDEEKQAVATSNIMDCSKEESHEMDIGKDGSVNLDFDSDGIAVFEDPVATLLSERFQSTDPITARARTLASIGAAISGKEPSISLHREKEPLNDYVQRDRIVYGGFPAVFPLGMGCGPGQGPLDPKVRLWLLKHFSRKPAQDTRFVMYMHNTKYRADSGRVMATYVKNDSIQMKKFFDMVNSTNFVSTLEKAIKEPDSDEAKNLIRNLAPLVMITGAKIPFSPLERGTAASSQLINMSRYYSYPNVLLTFGPDETRTALIARIACSQHPKLSEASTKPSKSAHDFWSKDNGNGDPDDFGEAANILPDLVEPLGEPTVIWRKEIRDAVTNDPVAVALMCQRLMDAVCDALLGVPINRNRKKSPQLSVLNKRKGAFGNLRAYFWVTELQGRLQLHWHLLGWGGIPHWLTQRCAGAGKNSKLGKIVAKVLDSAYKACCKPRTHAVRLLRKVKGVSALRPAYYCPPASSIDAQTILNAGESAAAYVNCHAHCFSCKKGNRGKVECRLAYGRPFSVLNKPIETQPYRFVNKNGKKNCVPHPLMATTPPHESTEVLDLENLEGLDEKAILLNLSQRLNLLANPGLDMRLIDYALKRTFIETPSSIFDDSEDVNGCLRTVLLRQYQRLVGTCKKLMIVPSEFDNTMDSIYNGLSSMSVSLGMGDIIRRNSLLCDDDVIEAIKQLLSIEQRIDFVDYLSQQNSLLGETSPLISAALGGNVNAQPLVSTQSCLSAMFYIIDYVTKDSMKPCQILSFVKEAKKRCDTYAGRAPLGEDPMENDRPMRRLGQVIQNGMAGAVEIGVQQCALNCAGLPSHEASDNFWYIFVADALKYLRKANARANGEDLNIAIDIQVNNDLLPPNSTTASRDPIDSTQSDDSVAFDPFKYIDCDAVDEADPSPIQSTAAIEMDSTGTLTTTTQFMEYINRDPSLCFLSLTEYGCVTNLVKAPYKSTEGKGKGKGKKKGKGKGKGHEVKSDLTTKKVGRNSNSSFAFETSYKLHDKFHCRLSSILRVPIYGGFKSVPMYTLGRENAFCEWVLAALLPIPKLDNHYVDIGSSPQVRLAKILPQLEKGKYLLNPEDGCYHGPPGYESVFIDSASANGKAYAFSQKCVSILIGTLAHGFTRPSMEIRKLQPIMRSRYCQQWDMPDPEARLFPEDYVKKHRTSRFSDDCDGDILDRSLHHQTDDDVHDFAVEALKQMFESSGKLIDTESDAVTGHMDAYEQDMKALYGILKQPESEIPVHGASTSTPLNLSIDGDSVAVILKAAEEDPPVREEHLEHGVSTGSELNTAVTTLQSMIAKLPWDKKPNIKQTEVLKRVAEYYDTFQDSNNSNLPPCVIFLEGAGGTGKSYLFCLIEELSASMNVSVCISATTGVACSAIKCEGVRTTHSLLRLNSVLSDLKNLSDIRLAEMRVRLKGVKLLIVDEVSFAAPSFIGAIDFRLREIMGNEQPFGGVAVIFSGDFYQLAPVKGIPIWKAAFKYGNSKQVHSLGDTLFSQLEVKGTQLFLSAQRYHLTTQMRCVDARHIQMLDSLRKGKPPDLEEYVLANLLTLADSEEFYNARIVSPGNPERFFMTKTMMSNFARTRRDRVISWHLNCYRAGTQRLIANEIGANPDVIDLLLQKNPQMLCHFVRGAPAFISSNINPLRGLANGTSCTLSYLQWNNPKTEKDALVYLASINGDAMLPDELRPSNVLVRPALSAALLEFWPKQLSCVENDIIIPVGVKKEKHLITCGSRTTKMAVNIEQPQYELGFITTVHKSQGATLDRVIISLLNRPTTPSRNCFFSVYVLLSRIRHGSHFRVLAKPDDLKFLNKLSPPDELIAFMEGYDETGRWVFEVAEAKLLQLQGAVGEKQGGKRKATSPSTSPQKRSRIGVRGSPEQGEKRKATSPSSSPQKRRRIGVRGSPERKKPSPRSRKTATRVRESPKKIRA